MRRGLSRRSTSLANAQPHRGTASGADVSEWFSVPERREAARAAILDVLAAVAPEEVEIMIGYVDPLLTSAARGEPVAFDSSEEAGRFGGGDWLVLAVAPLVVALIRESLAPQVPSSDGSVGGKSEPGGPRQAVSRQTVREVLRTVCSPYAEVRRDEILAALAAAAARRLAHLLP